MKPTLRYVMLKLYREAWGRWEYGIGGCISCIPRSRKVHQLCPKVSEGRVSAASRGHYRFDSCVLGSPGSECKLRPAVSKGVYHYRGIKCLEYSLNTTFRYNCTIETHRGCLSWKKELYRLRAKLSASCVFFCVPSRQQHACELQRKIWAYKMSSNLNALTQPYWKNNPFGGRRQAYYVPNIAHFKLFLWSDEITFSRKNLNAVTRSLGVPSTCPPNCAHIILIRFAESPVWYFVSILLFHVQKLFSWFSKYVW
jgi:hypothetical protein